MLKTCSELPQSTFGNGVDPRGAGKKQIPSLRYGMTSKWVYNDFENALYCIYIAPDVATVLEHAKLGGFPADSALAVRRVIDPSTAEQ
jgi:hypothetical protein